MKKLGIILLFIAFAFTTKAQTASKKPVADQEITKHVVDIACGECQFKMKGKSCDLAVRIDGKAYFVDGKNIDDFGDAHGKQGFCNAIGKAEVSGNIANNRFKAKDIRLLQK